MTAYVPKVPTCRVCGCKPTVVVPAARIWFDVSEAAERLGVSKMTVYREIHCGRLAGHRFGKSFRVTLEALERYIEGSRYAWDEVDHDEEVEA